MIYPESMHLMIDNARRRPALRRTRVKLISAKFKHPNCKAMVPFTNPLVVLIRVIKLAVASLETSRLAQSIIAG